jgi:lysozyme
MTVTGIDISKWNGNWDAVKAKNAGANFVIVKASQANFTDVKFVTNWARAKDAGLLRGAFHYLDYTKSGASQANYFADLLKDDPGELPPVVDYEARRSDNNIATALGFLREFLETLMARDDIFGRMHFKKPMLYMSPGFWKEYGTTSEPDYWTQFPLWVAHYTKASSPWVPVPWTKWVFWQYSPNGPGETYGSEALSMDMNHFNGSREELLAFAGRPVPVAETPGTPAPVPDSSGLTALVQRTENLEKQVAELKQAGSGLTPQFKQQVDAIETRMTALELRVATAFGQVGTSAPAVSVETATPAPAPIPAAVIPDAPISVTPVADPQPPTAAPAEQPAAPAAEPGLTATCITNALNVRSGPGASYPMVAGLHYGQQVRVLQRQNGWAQLEAPAGWSSEIYLSYEESIQSTVQAEAQAAGGNGTYAICNTSGLNVRNGPGATYPIVGGLTYGQRVRVLDRQQGWAQLERPSGWSNENYLSFS